MNKSVNLLKENDNFLIITHRKPDGDTIGSAAALCHILRATGKTAFVMKNEDITPRYGILVENLYPSDDFIPSFTISTDIASEDLLTPSGKKYAGNIDLCVDHHYLSNDHYAKHNLIEDFAACGELIYEIAKELNVPLNKEIALAIYYAVSTDTGCFRYSNTTPNTLDVASKCMPFIDGVGDLNRMLFDLKTMPRLAMEARIINDMVSMYDGKVVFIKVLQKDILETNATPDDLDNIASLPRTFDGCEISFSLSELKNSDIKVSVRTDGNISASELCKNFGGGGHARAAGCSFTGKTVDECIEILLDTLKKENHYV